MEIGKWQCNLGEHIDNVFVMSRMLEHVDQRAHEPTAKLWMTPRLVP